VEEAHNFIPSRGEGQSDTPSVEIIRKVITEGRKFGAGLLLISQRPSRLDETTLSQCNTFLIFRLVNPRDQNFVEKVMENLSKADSRLLPGFGPGQGIVSGQAVRFPLVVQVKHDADLKADGLGDEDFVVAVENWKNSAAAKAVAREIQLERELSDADIDEDS
jgi:DNA helicase HerA-like ATPase